MKTAVPAGDKTTQGAGPTVRARHSETPGPVTGRLAQLAAMVNQSPRVQTQLKLSQDLGASAPVVRQQALASQMNAASHRIEDEPAQLEQIAAPPMNGAVSRDQDGSGVERQTPRGQEAVVQLVTDPKSKNEAQARHLADQQRVYALVNQAATANVPPAAKPSRAKLLKNTAELIHSLSARLVVMSRTHPDPALRTKDEIGYFDLTVPYPNTGGDYNLAQDNHIYMAREGETGHADQHGEIRFYDPSGVSDENIKTVLIHETQHVIDEHNRFYKQPALDEHADSRAVNGYQTEFRAYWLGGIFGDRKHLGTSYDRLGFSFLPAANARKVSSGSLLTPNLVTAFKNQRQEEIFWHLIGSKSYDYVLTAYQNSQLFRNMVHDFTLPSGGNLLNSQRIDKIREHILVIYTEKSSYSDFLGKDHDSITTQEYERKRKDFKARIDAACSGLNLAYLALDREDLEFLNDLSTSAPFWEWARKKVGDQLMDRFYERIQNKASSLQHAEFLSSLGL